LWSGKFAVDIANHKRVLSLPFQAIGINFHLAGTEWTSCSRQISSLPGLVLSKLPGRHLFYHEQGWWANKCLWALSKHRHYAFRGRLFRRYGVVLLSYWGTERTNGDWGGFSEKGM